MGNAGFGQMEIPSFSDVPAPNGQRADAAAYSSEPSSLWTGSEHSTWRYIGSFAIRTTILFLLCAQVI